MPHKDREPLAASEDPTAAAEPEREPCAVQGPARDTKGRWLPGVSGNPAGSKPGRIRPRLVDVAQRQADAEGWNLEDALGAVVAAMLRKAAAGDVDAARLVLSRLAVDEPSPAELAALSTGPPIPSGADLVAYLDSLADMLEAGPPSPGARAMHAAANRIRVVR